MSCTFQLAANVARGCASTPPKCRAQFPAQRLNGLRDSHQLHRRRVSLQRVAAERESAGPKWWPESSQRGHVVSTRHMWFPVDLEVTNQQYIFRADVPGVSKHDIKVQVSKDRELSFSGGRAHPSESASLSTDSRPNSEPLARLQARLEAETTTLGDLTSEISSMWNTEPEPEPEVLHMSQERRFGKFRRTWCLPADADTSQIHATVEQGVLTVVIQRMPPAQPEVFDVPIQ